MKKIACVIVTYNRKVLLKNCLDAVASQTYKPHTVYITDNASTDGTMDSVKECGYYECEKGRIHFKYILNSKNEGGAGGFYLGMKTAHETGQFDALWVMDDDGVPDKECLEKLAGYLSAHDYISPLVLSDTNDSLTAFMGPKSKLSGLVHNGIIENRANPFNGILFSNDLISKVGYPKKEMFIWGDELNYDKRAKLAGFMPILVMSAIHHHPLDRQSFYTTSRGIVLRTSDTPWKMYCFIRNSVYNYRLDHSLLQTLRYSLAQIYNYSSFYFHKGQYASFLMVADAVLAGCRGYWKGMDRYFRT